MSFSTSWLGPLLIISSLAKPSHQRFRPSGLLSARAPASCGCRSGRRRCGSIRTAHAHDVGTIHQEDSHATNSAAQLLDRFGASSEALKGLVWILWLGRCSMAQIGAARPISCTATLRRLAAPCARAERVDLMCWLRRRQWRAVRLRTSWRLRTRADVAGVVCVIEVYTRGVRLVTFFASARLPETRTEPARRNLRSAGFATQGRRYSHKVQYNFINNIR